MLEKIEALRSNKTPDEIEQLLLDGELGEILTDRDGYQRIDNLALSWLVVQAHNPGFIECMQAHQWKYIVHHIDGNPLNNVYSNF